MKTLDEAMIIFLITMMINADNSLENPRLETFVLSQDDVEDAKSDVSNSYLEEFDKTSTTIEKTPCEDSCKNSEESANLQCSCSINCTDFGDCCIDAPVNATKEQKFSCLRALYSDSYYFMVTQCLETWKNNEIEIMCTSESEENSLTNLPVSNKFTGMTYKNIYCALCNDDFNIIPWTIIMKSKVDHKKISSEDIQKVITPSIYKLNTISIKPCKWDDSIISECPNDSIDARCYTYYAPVYNSYADIAYKNKYCAQCNGDYTDVQCLKNVDYNTFYVTKYGMGIGYSLLLDIDFTNGGNIVGEIDKCPILHIYDPWKEKCVNVFCSYNSTKCNDTEQLCRKYVKGEYRKLENGSVILNNYDIILKKEEYQKLNNSAIFVCKNVSNVERFVKFGEVYGYLTVICTSVSLFCLFLKIINYVCSEHPKKLPNTIICYLSISLFSAQLLFLVTINKIHYHTLCVASAILIHYTFLCSFFWNNVLSYDLWCTFSMMRAKKPTYSKTKMIKYSIYGWFLPVLIVLLAVLFEYALPESILKPNYAYTVCWFSSKISLLVFFALPIAILLMINTAFFISTAVHIAILSKGAKISLENSTCKERVRFQLYIKLALIMGITWIFGFIAAYCDNDILWYLFITLNGLQGVYILLAFTNFKFPTNLYYKRSSCSSTRSLTTQTSVSSRV
ncbi:uncharacterized protein LOC111624110 [Centruroides sculpturatus]|uniref:uncharacterized protein LOC111624110 n=1 Tax=Centruroides sculpturatus TaxID=218467 RepID=UPI000C6E0995|nr:uncharacterized protein LOC111624110 [Centruroides sculpturatus]XP_023222657.1 uncharacterized protein LOC111624110 [Centruroides sculpturatus]XP_023222658.1 uncharacterized protein LOC111624110 [Centruroides sculpturatus]